MEQNVPKKRGRPKKDPNKPEKSRVGKYPNNKNLPQNSYMEDRTTQAEKDSWLAVRLDETPANPMQTLSLQQMADRINGLDPTRKASKYANFVLAVKRISEGVNKKDVEDMRRRFYQYVALCEATNMKIGNMNAYSAMGINKNDARCWLNGLSGSSPDRMELIREVDSVCSGYREQLIADQQINPVTGIFWQKNYDGLRDVQEHSFNTGDPLGEKRSAKEIAEQYADIIED